MAQSRYSRRGYRVVLFTTLFFLMTLPAAALFQANPEKVSNRVDSGAPIAENLSLLTYKNVAINGMLAAVDTEGDPVTFRIMKNPARGAVSFAQEGGASFTYTPYEDKTGKDSFTYVAEDANGNVSAEAKVSIQIKKPDTKVTYADLSGHPAHKAAIELAERDIFVGEQMGNRWFFRPETAVTREEFLAMAMDTVELDRLEGITATGFADDASVSTWAKPYVASALQSGMVQGSQQGGRTVFQPDNRITQAEATVLLNRLLCIADVVPSRTEETAAPAWACQSVANLKAVGIRLPESDTAHSLDTALTRGDAAQMLSSALAVLEFRETTW